MLVGPCAPPRTARAAARSGIEPAGDVSKISVSCIRARSGDDRQGALRGSPRAFVLASAAVFTAEGLKLILSLGRHGPSVYRRPGASSSEADRIDGCGTQTRRRDGGLAGVA
jgi:hypothetical protein